MRQLWSFCDTVDRVCFSDGCSRVLFSNIYRMLCSVFLSHHTNKPQSFEYVDGITNNHTQAILSKVTNTILVNNSRPSLDFHVTLEMYAKEILFWIPVMQKNFSFIIFFDYEVKNWNKQKDGPGLDTEFLGQIFKLFSRNKSAKNAIKLFVAMANGRLPTNFQLNIFIFVARASLQTLLQS